MHIRRVSHVLVVLGVIPRLHMQLLLLKNHGSQMIQVVLFTNELIGWSDPTNNMIMEADFCTNTSKIQHRDDRAF